MSNNCNRRPPSIPGLPPGGDDALSMGLSARLSRLLSRLGHLAGIYSVANACNTPEGRAAFNFSLSDGSRRGIEFNSVLAQLKYPDQLNTANGNPNSGQPSPGSGGVPACPSLPLPVPFVPEGGGGPLSPCGDPVLPPQSSPLVLDLDGDGVEADGYGYFDHDGEGFLELTYWSGADDGTLVWDRNGDGVISDGSELFGSNAVLANGEQAEHGFAALAELDDNGDGVVDTSDAVWSNLQILR